MKTVITTANVVQKVGKGRLDAEFYTRLSEHAEATTGDADIRSETRAESVLDDLTNQTAQNIETASDKRAEARQLQAEARELEKDAPLLGMKPGEIKIFSIGRQSGKSIGAEIARRRLLERHKGDLEGEE